MNILTIPLRNCRRKWPRTLLLTAVFAAGVASIVSLVSISRVVGHSLEQKLTAYGANILVAPKRESLHVSYGGFQLGEMLVEQPSLPEADAVARIRSIRNSANVAVVAPKLVAMARLDSGPLGVVGVRLKEELNIKSYWIVDGAFPAAPGELLLGSAAAARLGLAPGAALSLFDRPFTVSGVLRPTGGDDDHVALADIAAVQELSGRVGKASFIEVAALCAGCPIEDIVSQIAEALPGVEVTAVRSVIEQRMFSIRFIQNLVLAVSIVILATACAMIGLSMLSAVSERKKEIGVLRSLGYSRPGVFTIFASEALLLGLAAGLLGHLGGQAISQQVLAVLDMLPDMAHDHGGGFPWLEFLATGGVFALLAVLSAALPALKATRVDPSQALTAL